MDLLNGLHEIGRHAYQEGQIIGDVSGFYLPGLAAAGYPQPGSPGWTELANKLFDELHAAGSASGGWALAGAFHVAKDFSGPGDLTNPRFVEIMDEAIAFMAAAGVSANNLPPFALEHWRSRHGPYA